ncbi:MAG: hypothetical protein AB1374_10935 [Bacillota bacterium]
MYLVRSLQADDSTSPLARAWQDTVRVLQGVVKNENVDPAVDAFDINMTREAVKQTTAGLTARGFKTVVNFTGGTKCPDLSEGGRGSMASG